MRNRSRRRWHLLRAQSGPSPSCHPVLLSWLESGSLLWDWWGVGRCGPLTEATSIEVWPGWSGSSWCRGAYLDQPAPANWYGFNRHSGLGKERDPASADKSCPFSKQELHWEEVFSDKGHLTSNHSLKANLSSTSRRLSSFSCWSAILQCLRSTLLWQALWQ